MEQETRRLIERAESLQNIKTGDPINNRDEAIHLYQQALIRMGYPARDLDQVHEEVVQKQRHQPIRPQSIANPNNPPPLRQRALLPHLLKLSLPLLLLAIIMTNIATLLLPLLLDWNFNHDPLTLCSTGTITISASSVLQPLMQEAGQEYQQRCSGAHISVNLPKNPDNVDQYNPDGIGQLDTDPTVAIGTAEVPATITQHQFWDNQIAITTFVLIANKDAGIRNLTTANITDIYSGKSGNWQQICSQTIPLQCGKNSPITIIDRPVNSNVRATFEQYVLGSAEYTLNPAKDISPDEDNIAQNIINTPGAIGYVTLKAAQKAHISPLTIDGNAPTLDSIKKGSYTFWAVEHLYTRGSPTGLAEKFIHFMHTEDGMSLLRSYGFWSIIDVLPKTIQNHLVKTQ